MLRESPVSSLGLHHACVHATLFPTQAWKPIRQQSNTPLQAAWRTSAARSFCRRWPCIHHVLWLIIAAMPLAWFVSPPKVPLVLHNL